MRRWTSRAALCVGLLSAATGVALAGLDQVKYHVSQKGRAFQPADLVVIRGETVQIINDDGDLLHHAYVESDQFSFDSGDQQPGSKANITFTVPGVYMVLCGIHPKMKLVVQVK